MSAMAGPVFRERREPGGYLHFHTPGSVTGGVYIRDG